MLSPGYWTINEVATALRGSLRQQGARPRRLGQLRPGGALPAGAAAGVVGAAAAHRDARVRQRQGNRRAR